MAFAATAQSLVRWLAGFAHRLSPAKPQTLIAES
jgi:hypothetical protein